MGNEHSQDKKGKKGAAQSPQPVGKYSNLSGAGSNASSAVDDDFFIIKDLDKEFTPKVNEPPVGDLIGLSSLPAPTPITSQKPLNPPVNKQTQPPIKTNIPQQQPIQPQGLTPLKNTSQPAISNQPPLKTANQPNNQLIQTQAPLKTQPNTTPNPQVNLQPKPSTPVNNQPVITNKQVTPVPSANIQANSQVKTQTQVSNNPPNVAVNNNAKNQPEVKKPVEIKPVEVKPVEKKEVKSVEVKNIKLIDFARKFEPSINVPNCQYSSSPCHLNITEASTIEAHLSIEVDIPNVNTNISNYILYATVPPVTSFQTHSEISVKLETPVEASVVENAVVTSVTSDTHAREILQIKIDATKIGSNFFGKKLILKLGYKANVYGRELFYDPNVQIPYQVATDTELYSAITSTESFNFTNDFYYNYLQENSVLWRLDAEVGVDSIFFAHRVYQYIFNNFKYDESIPTSHQTLQQIISNRKANSFGLSLLFCTILRSQSLPARSVIGRWVVNESTVKKPLSTQIPHVLSEFFIEQVGWVPADITSMVLFGENMPFSAQGTMPFFGHSSANFLGFHVDYDFQLDSVYSGSKNVIDLLNPAVFINLPNTSVPKVHSNWKLLSREVLN